MNDIWWDLGQTLIWIATRDLGWVAELQPRANRLGMPEKREPFGHDFAAAALQKDVIAEFSQSADPKPTFEALIAGLQSEQLTAIEAGVIIPAAHFAGVRIGDHYAATAFIGELALYRLDAAPADSSLMRRDAILWRPIFLAEQVRHAYPPVASRAEPISARGLRLLAQAGAARPNDCEGIVTRDFPSRAQETTTVTKPARRIKERKSRDEDDNNAALEIRSARTKVDLWRKANPDVRSFSGIAEEASGSAGLSKETLRQMLAGRHPLSNRLVEAGRLKPWQ